MTLEDAFKDFARALRRKALRAHLRFAVVAAVNDNFEWCSVEADPPSTLTPGRACFHSPVSAPPFPSNRIAVVSFPTARGRIFSPPIVGCVPTTLQQHCGAPSASIAASEAGPVPTSSVSRPVSNPIHNEGVAYDGSRDHGAL